MFMKMLFFVKSLIVSPVRLWYSRTSRCQFLMLTLGSVLVILGSSNWLSSATDDRKILPRHRCFQASNPLFSSAAFTYSSAWSVHNKASRV